ncbi:MAG: helix-turn-helix domain-containing protein [Candidatus Tectomicrobia bacterium]|nr:helix-turn-helix domain-containing protein [Candidatus Tectomicrobia bacterium]
MSWKKLLESVSESLNDHIQLRNDYLMAENRILRDQIDGRVQLTDSERKELAEIGAKLGKQALEEIATVAQPDTIFAWNRKFADQKVKTSEPRKSVGRPRVDQEIEDWVVRMARENRSWGYDRIQGSLNHLGYTISDQTVGTSSAMAFHLPLSASRLSPGENSPGPTWTSYWPLTSLTVMSGIGLVWLSPIS